MPFGAGADAVIGDVVHLAAKGIDREHGVALTAGISRIAR